MYIYIYIYWRSFHNAALVVSEGWAVHNNEKYFVEKMYQFFLSLKY